MSLWIYNGKQQISKPKKQTLKNFKACTWKNLLTSSFPPSFSCLLVFRLQQLCQRDRFSEYLWRLVNDRRHRRVRLLPYPHIRWELLRHLLRKQLKAIKSPSNFTLRDQEQRSKTSITSKSILSHRQGRNVARSSPRRALPGCWNDTKISKLRSNIQNKSRWRNLLQRGILRLRRLHPLWQWINPHGCCG